MGKLLPTSLHKTVQCQCGKVKLAIDSIDVLRLVCYCKDCRGYFNTLNSNNNKAASSHGTAAILDPWGGVDWTQLYPSEIRVLEGRQHLACRILRRSSKIMRVHASCCSTPLFTQGTMSAMLNSHLLSANDVPPVRFRIVGRDSLKGDGQQKPEMSWSVPLSWFWVMPRRIHEDRMSPSPLEENIADGVPVLEKFKQG